MPLQGIGDAFTLAIVVLLGLPVQEITAGFAAAVGNTPLVRLNRLSAETGREILGKAEFTNPGESLGNLCLSVPGRP